jgi:cephalosporin-C deacetylase
MAGMLRRRGLILAALLFASCARLVFGGVSAEAASPRVGREPEVQLHSLDDGSLEVIGGTYRALIGSDGNLHSLRVGEVEMLDDQTAISLGGFFYAGGPRKLGEKRHHSAFSVEVTDGTYAAQYRFSRDEVTVLLTNSATKPVPYFVVLSPAVRIARRADGTEAAAVPADERWGAVRFSTESGAYLELRGGTRVWGPWLGRQVWEVSQIPPGGRREIGFRAGRGEPPKPTLEQLVGVRAALSPEDGLYPAGRPIEMAVSLDNRSDGDVEAALSVELSATRQDVVIYNTSPVELPAKQVTEKQFLWQMSAPDFYAINVTATAGDREVGAARVVAGYMPEDIQPRVSRPAGFDQFWRRVLAEVGAEPPEYRMRRDDRRSRRGIEVWVVQYKSVAGRTIHAWYAMPARARGRPGILYLSGYGARPIDPPVGLAHQGWVVLAIDVRGNPVDRVRPRPFEDYCTEGIESPDGYVYREIVEHALSALNFLGSRPEADPDRVAVVGVSEGGGLAILLGALSLRVRAVAADAPMLVDFPLSLRAAGWPYTQIARYLHERPEAAEGAANTVAHFDAVNFAPDVRCPVLLSVGFLDEVSLPAAVFGLYNVLPGPKEIQAFPDAGHEGGGEKFWFYRLQWLREQLETTE